jgi:hypothetical protein
MYFRINIKEYLLLKLHVTCSFGTDSTPGTVAYIFINFSDWSQAKKNQNIINIESFFYKEPCQLNNVLYVEIYMTAKYCYTYIQNSI